MAEGKRPFHSFSFTLVQNKRPRSSFRLAEAEGGLYELKVQLGSAANPTKQVARKVPQETAERLRDALQDIGVFGWEESYGDTSAPGSCRWTTSTVFQEGVFSVESRGGSDTPPGFDRLLEELYRLDFPRADGGRSTAAPEAARAFGMPGMTSLPSSIGDLAAYASNANMPGFDGANMGQVFADLQQNPQALQQRMRDEFRRLSPDEQNQMLDALAAMGFQSRAWWERFLRG